jgi:pyruvate-formate lyase
VLFWIHLKEILTGFGTSTQSLGWNGRLTKWGAMAVTHIKAEEFRRLAQECRATAQTLSTEQARAEMLAMADVCDPVAAQPTHGNDLSEAARPPARNPQILDKNALESR